MFRLQRVFRQAYKVHQKVPQKAHQKVLKIHKRFFFSKKEEPKKFNYEEQSTYIQDYCSQNLPFLSEHICYDSTYQQTIILGRMSLQLDKLIENQNQLMIQNIEINKKLLEILQKK